MSLDPLLRDFRFLILDQFNVCIYHVDEENAEIKIVDMASTREKWLQKFLRNLNSEY